MYGHVLDAQRVEVSLIPKNRYVNHKFDLKSLIKITRLVTRLARKPGSEMLVSQRRGCNYCASLLSVFKAGFEPEL